MAKIKITRFFAVLLALILMSSVLNVNAATVRTEDVPGQSYSFWQTSSKNSLVYGKPFFNYKSSISASSLKIRDFNKISDMCIGDNGYIYLTDEQANELIIVDDKFNYVKTITDFKLNNEMIKLQKASSVFVKGGNIYICDSVAGKVYVSNINGEISYAYSAPDKSKLPEGFLFQPIKVAIDDKGYIFVLSEGSYYGAIVYNEDKEFIGFYGANKVANTALDVIGNLWKKLTYTNEKRANSSKALPYSFTDLCIDSKGFVYTTTGATGERGLQTGVIRMLSPGGVNVMKSESAIFGQQILGNTSVGGIIKQDICGLCVDDDGFIYTYDRSLGNIYMYDSDCNMMIGFGGGYGEGEQKGTFKVPCAIEIFGSDLYVCDGLTGIITVYEMTEYGKQIRKLQKKTLAGEYSDIKAGWQQIINENKNYQLAYSGLAKVAFAEEDYKASLSYAKQGDDKITYAKAFEKVREQYLSKNFTWLFCVSIALIGLIVFLLIYKKKKNIIIIKNQKTKLMFMSMIHPFNVFSEIKEKKMGSTVCGVLSLTAFYISTVIKNDFCGFIFEDSGSLAYNSLVVLFRTIGAVLIWVVANWMVCTLLGGLGKIKEIFVAITYALIPMTIVNLLYTVLSHCFVESEASFLSLLLFISELYFVIILAIATMKIHDFSFGRFIGTTILTVLGLLLIIFIIAVTFILVQQIVSFFVTLTYEIVLR